MSQGFLIQKKTNTRDTLRVNLKINYITERALQSDTIIKCGWITLDNQNKIQHFSIDYLTLNLNSHRNFSRGYNYQISTQRKVQSVRDSLIETLKQ
jgi:hypothetical protein